MSIVVSWVDEAKTTISREFNGSWSWDDFYSSQQQVNEMLRSVDHKVHQILDFTQTHSMPPNTLTHIGNSGRNMPGNRGKSVVVTRSSFYKQMYGLLSRMFPSVTERVVLVATRDEALEKLQLNRAEDPDEVTIAEL